MHSHLVPGVDDGVDTTDETIQVVESMAQSGIKKIITTPHIYPDVYPNKEQKLKTVFEELKSRISEKGIAVEFQLGAEYFMHQQVLDKLDQKQPLLAFGKHNYLLLETPFGEQPMIWDKLLFELKYHGYQPIIAHPERYSYVAKNIDLVASWREQGLLMQLNIPSLLGSYGVEVQKVAKKLINRGWVDLLGSDIHKLSQISLLERARKSKLFHRATVLVQHNSLI